MGGCFSRYRFDDAIACLSPASDVVQEGHVTSNTAASSATTRSDQADLDHLDLQSTVFE
jgi:hypothetical protein